MTIAVWVLAFSIIILLGVIGWQYKQIRALRAVEPVYIPVRPPRKVIIAGNHQQAQFLLRSWDMSPRDAIIASDIVRLRGLGDCEVYWYGTYDSRHDLVELQQWVAMQRSCGHLKHVEVVDEPMSA